MAEGPLDELPRDAKDLIALARAAEEPPAAARERVRHAVALTLAAGVAASAGHAAAASGAGQAVLKAGFLSTLPGKLALVSGAVMVIGTSAVLMPRTPANAPEPSRAAVAAPRTVAPRTAVADAPTVLQPALAPSVEISAPTLSANEPASQAVRAHKGHASAEAARDESLRAEMTMLHDASTALDRGAIEQARSLLKAHRVQHGNGQLREERQGLEALARCMANEAGSENSARTYLRSAPQGVLAARIERACIHLGTR